MQWTRLDQVNMLAFELRTALGNAFLSNGFVVTPEEWSTLRNVQADPGVTPSKLSDGSGRDRTTTTRMIDRLVKKALVERRADRNDRRVQRLFLTRAGYEAYAGLSEVAEGLAARIIEEIDPQDLAAFDAIVAEMRRALQRSG